MKSLRNRIGEIGIVILVEAGIIAGGLLVTRIYNNILNNKTINTPAYSLVSYATDLSGHVEYVKFSEGSQEVKEYPSLGHGMIGSKLYEDFNGDGLVDRIRENGAAWKEYRITRLLVRNYDYNENSEIFDKADKELQELMQKYSK